MLTDAPAKPGGVVVSDYNVDYVRLSWDEPVTDGGSAVTRYVIERRDAASRKYRQVGTTDGRTYRDDGLTRGAAYMFRVAAENEVGRGEFCELEGAQTAKLPFGESRGGDSWGESQREIIIIVFIRNPVP